MNSAAHEGDKLSTHSCRLFSLAEIKTATKDFDDELVIGQGGFGKVYKGQISSEAGDHVVGDHVVAIKRLDSMSSQGELEFRAEIETLSKLHHCHLVPLIGYCDENEEMILVYKYMPNGTLYHHLHKAETPLTWVQRLNIAIGAGRGLDYLHTGVGTRHGIIHRDVKSSNILLDENWEALVSDFGLSKIGPTNQSSSHVDASVKGTFGYLDPEYFYTRRLTRKTDVFAFGVVLFELLSGRLPVDMRHGEEYCSLVRWAQRCVKERKLDQFVDSNIRGTIYPKCLRRFAQTAYQCLLSVPKERPTMTLVVASLQDILETQKKHDNFADSISTMRFTWKIHKYLASVTKQNSDQSTGSLTNKDVGDHNEMPNQHGELVARDLKIFTYDELKRASMDFGNDKLLGKGVHGAVYKGWLDKVTYSPCMHDTGLPITIKRLNSYKHFDPDVLKEFCHPNLVKLIGYCLEGVKLFLVYEFMSNGNLNDLFWRGAIEELPLVIKVKIVVGIARAIVFLHKTQDEVKADPHHRGATVGEYQLHRHKILLDENFTAKLLDYDVTKIIHGHYPNSMDLLSDKYYPGFMPLPLQTNLYGFIVLLAEVLTGRQIYYENDIQKINDFLCQRGKLSLSHIANSCFEMYDDVDLESKLLRMLEGYDKYIPEIIDQAFTISNKSYLSIREMCTMKGHMDSAVRLKGLNIDTDQLHYSV